VANSAPTYAGAIELLQAGSHHAAETALRQIVAANPTDVDALSLLGVACSTQEKLEDSVTFFELAARLQPTPERLCNLGAALAKAGLLDPAAAAYRRALQLDPRYPEAHRNYGVCRLRAGDEADAERHFREALRLRPAFPEAIQNLLSFLRQREDYGEGVRLAEQLVDLQPHNPVARFELGVVLQRAGRMADAVASYLEAVRLKPDYAAAHLNRGLTLLALGEFSQGWGAFEWRWAALNLARPETSAPVWDGSDPCGRRVLLWAEQGLGDTLQFIRYARILQERGATVIFRSPPALRALLTRTPGIDVLLSEDDPLPVCDLQAPLMTLPALLGTDSPELIPAQVPYVYPDPALVEYWTPRIRAIPALRVGICWQGNSQHPEDRIRSLRPEFFAPLAAIPGVRLISLQKDAAEHPASGSLEIATLDGLDRESGPFMDTAAVMRSLHLVVTCDSSVGHLAGAMGVPVWLALPFAADWRWLTGRAETPWYPNTRLFRQRVAGDWEGVFARMAAAIRDRAAGRLIPVESSPAEVLDRLTILSIKLERLPQQDRRESVRDELERLESAWARALVARTDLGPFVQGLREVNEALWTTEERIRACERLGDFGPRFVQAARDVIQQNALRSRIKQSINLLMRSPVVEQKSYLDPD
jgi:Flp pilus assembly protein TadD